VHRSAHLHAHRRTRLTRTLLLAGRACPRPAPTLDEVLEAARRGPSYGSRDVERQTPQQRTGAHGAVRRRGREPEARQEALHPARARQRGGVHVGRTGSVRELRDGLEHRVTEPSSPLLRAHVHRVEAQDHGAGQQPRPQEPAQHHAGGLAVAGRHQGDAVRDRREHLELVPQQPAVVRAQLATDTGLRTRLQAEVDEILEIGRRRASDVHTWPHCGPPGDEGRTSGVRSPGPYALRR